MALLGSMLLIALLGQLVTGRTTMLVPAVGGRYVEALVGYPQQINPILARYGTPERDLCALIFSGLTRAETDGEILPELARAWEVSGDGLTYTFYLRRDVRWHDGAPFTARDVVFTVSLIQSSNSARLTELAAAWQDVETQATDAYTVVFRLPQAYSPFLEQTTLGLLPSHLLDDLPPAQVIQRSFNQQPAGTGPFRLETLTAEYARLVPHAQFYGPRPFLGQLEFRFYPDASRALTAYSRGEVMGIAGIPPALLDRAASQPDLNLFTSPLYGYTLVVLNNRRPIFADKRVRQALAFGLDRQALIDDVLNGQGIAVHSPVMPGNWAYDPDVQRYYLNIPRAEGLLDTAGWHYARFSTPVPEDAVVASLPDLRVKGDESFAFSLLTSDDPVHQHLATALAGHWSRLGVQVTVEPVPSSVRDSRLYAHQFDAALLEMALSADPDVYPWWHSTQAEGSQNFAGFSSFAADQALQQARLVAERGQRWAFYRAFQQVFAEEVPAILLYQPVYIYGVDQEIKNVQQAPLLEPSHRFRDIHNWYLITQRVIVQQRPTPVR
jgi:peptide/nickel transport system substrate-binding protein